MVGLDAQRLFHSEDGQFFGTPVAIDNESHLVESDPQLVYVTQCPPGLSQRSKIKLEHKQDYVGLVQRLCLFSTVRVVEIDDDIGEHGTRHTQRLAHSLGRDNADVGVHAGRSQ